MQNGPVPMIQAAQQPDGFLVKLGPGYSPKYTSTVWQLIALAQFGVDGEAPKVNLACNYILDNGRSFLRSFSANGRQTGLVHCLQGNLAAALID